jgi:hypothetical protein
MVVRNNRGGMGKWGRSRRGEGVVQEVDCLHLDEVWASNVQLSGEHVPLGQGETQRSTIVVCPRLQGRFLVTDMHQADFGNQGQCNTFSHSICIQ